MSTGRIEFRRATHTDGYRLFDWRNDPQTRAASLNTEPVLLHRHLDWLHTTLLRPDRQIFIAELDRVPVGTVRADCVADGVELSWTVAPEYRGRGLGTRMVRQFAASFECALIAIIKAENLASQRIAQAAGLACSQEIGGLMHFRRPAQVRQAA